MRTTTREWAAVAALMGVLVLGFVPAARAQVPFLPDAFTTSERAAIVTQRIIVVGDSIQTGIGLKSTQNQATFRLQRYGGVVVHNFTSPGATMANWFLPGMEQATTAVHLLDGYAGMYGLVVNLGVNDWGGGDSPGRFSPRPTGPSSTACRCGSRWPAWGRRGASTTGC
jgi:hypothetical protein